MARATWTDERLDDLARRIEDGFNRVDEDIRALRTDLNSRLDLLEGRLDGRVGVSMAVSMASAAASTRCSAR
jgi:hypothetical protein